MTDIYTNPFHPDQEPDRHTIWEMLVARDSDAFVKADWSMVEDDFIADQFEGVTANGSSDPGDWTLTYPTLAAYRDDWISGAEAFQQMPLVGLSHRELVYKLTTLNRIEIAGDRALCHKKFLANELLADGRRYLIACQTLYRVHRIRGVWKIVGFIGYFPLPGMIDRPAEDPEEGSL